MTPVSGLNATNSSLIAVIRKIAPAQYMMGQINAELELNKNLKANLKV